MTCDTCLYGVQEFFCVIYNFSFQMQLLFQYVLQELEYNKQIEKKYASLKCRSLWEDRSGDEAFISTCLLKSMAFQQCQEWRKKKK